MANPTVSAVLNKSTYAPGETVSLTVTYADADNTTTVVTVTGTDAAGHPATVQVNLVVGDAVTLAVSDTGTRTWVKQSDSGSVAVFTATA